MLLVPVLGIQMQESNLWFQGQPGSQGSLYLDSVCLSIDLSICYLSGLLFQSVFHKSPVLLSLHVYRSFLYDILLEVVLLRKQAFKI